MLSNFLDKAILSKAKLKSDSSVEKNPENVSQFHSTAMIKKKKSSMSHCLVNTQ